MSFAEQLAADGEGLLGQFQGVFRVAELVVVAGDVVETCGRISMQIAEQLVADGEGLIGHFQGVPRMAKLIKLISQIAI